MISGPGDFLSSTIAIPATNNNHPGVDCSASRVDAPVLRVDTPVPQEAALEHTVTTVGRGPGVDIVVDDQSVSRLHAELVRRGPYVYVADLGLSTNGTLVNGRPIGRAVLGLDDVISFGAVRARLIHLSEAALPDSDTRVFERRERARELTRREQDVINALCHPAASRNAFVEPASTREIARRLYVSEAAVKQHLLRLYQKFAIPEGDNRRTRLANEVIAAGLVPPPRTGGG